MKEILCFIAGGIISLILFSVFNTNVDYCTNNDTRDLNYEQYVDGARIYDPKTFDSIQYTPKYQNYIREHGEWFNNLNY